MKPSVLILIFASMAVLQEPARASSADAENFLKKAVGEVVEIAKNAPDSDALAAKVRPVLLKCISFDAMTRRAVGPGWRQFTEAQQSEATGLFTSLIIRRYSANFTPGELPEITYKAAVSPAPGRVEVSTATLYKGSKYDVTYRLEEQAAKAWSITDVVIEGVSMVANYRTQFDAQFKSGGANAIIGSLKKSVSSPR